MASSAADRQTAAPRSLKERQREERATLILKAASDIFAEKGYHEASIDDIATRVGIAKGTVYLHYPSKEDLMVALIEQQLRSFSEMVDQVAAQHTSVRARIEQIMERSYANLNANRTQLLSELNTSIGITRQLIAGRESLREHYMGVKARIAELLEEGKRSGELDATIPTSILLTTLLNLLSPKAFEQLLKDESLSTSEIVAQVCRVYFNGILSPASTEL